MRIGVPKEIKELEARVALMPAGVRELVRRGHEVVLEYGAGAGSGIADEQYAAEGARLADVDEVFDTADLLVKVKEPQRVEALRLRPGQTLFTYLHLAAEPDLTELLCASGATCIAYETVEDAQGRLPLLAPMSRIAGTIAAQVAATTVLRHAGGRGRLIGLVPGAERAKVVVIGGGIAGSHAAATAIGMGAEVTVLDRSIDRLDELQARFAGAVRTIFSSEVAVEEQLADADAVIGTVLVKGARAPSVVSRAHLRLLPRGAVLVDVSIDQGGCFETSRPTTHSEPTFDVDGIVHYCVTNMPGAVPVTATAALTNATIPYVLALADYGPERAVERSPELRAGVNVRDGAVVHPAVAETLRDAMPVSA